MCAVVVVTSGDGTCRGGVCVEREGLCIEEKYA